MQDSQNSKKDIPKFLYSFSHIDKFNESNKIVNREEETMKNSIEKENKTNNNEIEKEEDKKEGKKSTKNIEKKVEKNLLYQIILHHFQKEMNQIQIHLKKVVILVKNHLNFQAQQ